MDKAKNDRQHNDDRPGSQTTEKASHRRNFATVLEHFLAVYRISAIDSMVIASCEGQYLQSLGSLRVIFDPKCDPQSDLGGRFSQQFFC